MPDRKTGQKTDQVLLHGSCVAMDGSALLLRGASGSGKSDLALRLMAAGGVLVADDQTLLERRGDRLYASPAPALAGKIEVRGVGILNVDFVSDVRLALLVDLTGQVPDRLPDPVFEEILSLRFPLLSLRPFEASAVAKLKVALKTVVS